MSSIKSAISKVAMAQREYEVERNSINDKLDSIEFPTTATIKEKLSIFETRATLTKELNRLNTILIHYQKIQQILYTLNQ